MEFQDLRKTSEHGGQDKEEGDDEGAAAMVVGEEGATGTEEDLEGEREEGILNNISVDCEEDQRPEEREGKERRKKGREKMKKMTAHKKKGPVKPNSSRGLTK